MTPTYQGYVKTNSTIDIFNGDLIILQKKTPQVGDVILFKPVNENKLYFHRVIAELTSQGHTYYLTKGDDNRYTDISSIGDTKFGWIPQENVLGVAILTVHWVGWFVSEMTSLNFIIPFLGMIILVGIFYISAKEEIIKRLNNFKLRSRKNKILKYKNKLIHFRKLHSKKGITVVFVGLILLSALSAELFNAETNSIDVHLLQTDGNPLPDSINLSNPHLFDLETVTYGGISVYFFNIKMQLTSGGLFNSLESVKIRVLSQQDSLNQQYQQLYYRWLTTYHFSGTKTVNADLIIPSSYFTANNSTMIINIHYTVSHVLFQDNYAKNIPIVFS